jgi:ABC-2 type transport system ATP-binding protein
MKTLLENIQETKSHLQHGDNDLGTRRFIDCLLDSNNIDLYREGLNLINNSLNFQLNGLTEPVVQLLEKIGNVSNSHFESQLLLEFSKVKKQYPNSRFKIEDIDFQLHQGQVLGLVGENGNGKTTLLRIAAQELNNDQGQINYHFKNKPDNPYELKSKLVYMPQRIPSWKGKLLDNLHFCAAFNGNSPEFNELYVELMLARLGILKFKKHSWSQISSGYKTRFELVRNLIRQPEILLLDEPLSNLDINSQQTILMDLKHMSESIVRPFGLILSSQQLYEVEKIADSVIFIKNGKANYQNKDVKEENSNVIFEIECNANREELMTHFSKEELIQIQYNGGVFTLHFTPDFKTSNLFKTISEKEIEVKYIRNISTSTKRFFINS